MISKSVMKNQNPNVNKEIIEFKSIKKICSHKVFLNLIFDKNIHVLLTLKTRYLMLN